MPVPRSPGCSPSAPTAPPGTFVLSTCLRAEFLVARGSGSARTTVSRGCSVERARRRRCRHQVRTVRQRRPPVPGRRRAGVAGAGRGRDPHPGPPGGADRARTRARTSTAASPSSSRRRWPRAGSARESFPSAPHDSLAAVAAQVVGDREAVAVLRERGDGGVRGRRDAVIARRLRRSPWSPAPPGPASSRAWSDRGGWSVPRRPWPGSLRWSRRPRRSGGCVPDDELAAAVATRSDAAGVGRHGDATGLRPPGQRRRHPLRRHRRPGGAGGSPAHRRRRRRPGRWTGGGAYARFSPTTRWGG